MNKGNPPRDQCDAWNEAAETAMKEAEELHCRKNQLIEQAGIYRGASKLAQQNALATIEFVGAGGPVGARITIPKEGAGIVIELPSKEAEIFRGHIAAALVSFAEGQTP